MRKQFQELLDNVVTYKCHEFKLKGENVCFSYANETFYIEVESQVFLKEKVSPKMRFYSGIYSCLNYAFVYLTDFVKNPLLQMEKPKMSDELLTLVKTLLFDTDYWRTKEVLK